MQTTSDLSLAADRAQPVAGAGTSGIFAAFAKIDPSPILIRWAGHLPYFLLGSRLMLPQELSIGSAVVIGLLYAVFGHFIAMWIRKPLPAEAGSIARATRPVAGALTLLLAMSVLAPAVALSMPGQAGAALVLQHLQEEGFRLWQSYLALMLPACLGFYAVQVLTARR